MKDHERPVRFEDRGSAQSPHELDPGLTKKQQDLSPLAAMDDR